MDKQQLIHKMRRELFILKAYALLSASMLVVLWFTGFSPKGNNQHFGEIDVERLNIVDSTGKFSLVITNGSRAPGAIIGGKEIRRANSNGVPAILFYNEHGDESGALYSVGNETGNGEYFGSSRLVFDRFKNDETLAFQYYEDQLGGYAGMLVQDTRDMSTAEYITKQQAINAMPDGNGKSEAQKAFDLKAGPWATKRLFIGKYDKSKSAVVELRDRKGNTRLLLDVDSLGVPGIDFLNENGDVTYRLSDSTLSRTRK